MYHYTECGLHNVWLENGYAVKKTPYGEAVAINDVPGLHKLIGCLIARRPLLTGAELRFLRKEMELSQKALSELLGTSEQNVSLWERRGKVPKWSARLMKLIYLDQLEGHVQIRKMIERLNEQDSKAQEELRFKSRLGLWKTAA